MNEYKYPFGTYKENMDRFLEQFGDGETFYVRLEPSDLLVMCRKDTFYRDLNENMPLWFLKSCQGFKKNEGRDSYEPVFNRVQQAAWDAANEAYLNSKQAWCDKYGCN